MSVGLYTTHAFALTAVRGVMRFERLWYALAQKTGLEAPELKRRVKTLYGHVPDMEELQAVLDYCEVNGGLPDWGYQLDPYR